MEDILRSNLKTLTIALRQSLSEITQPSRNATVVVTLDSILPEAMSVSGTVRYQRLIFKDKAGIEIPTTLFDEDIELFSGVFREQKDYEITNALITPIREDVRRGSQIFQMLIRSSTRVVELAPSTVATRSYLVPLDSAIEHLDSQERTDIIGVAIHVYEARKVRPKRRGTEFDVRDIVLLDRSMRPTTLTVWQAFVSTEAQSIADVVATRPVVIATRVTASKFSGGSWNTTFFSTIRLDYEGPEALALKRWEIENDAEIMRITENLPETVGESRRTIVPIAALGFQEDGSTVWIKGRVSHVINPERCVHAACSECKNATEVAVGENFSCFRTDKPHIGTSEYRFNVQVRFEDVSSAIKLTLFEELAEKVLQSTAAQISILSAEERLSLLSDFIDKVRDRLFVVKLLAKQCGEFRKQLRFSPLHVEEVDE